MPSIVPYRQPEETNKSFLRDVIKEAIAKVFAGGLLRGARGRVET
jgi:hypothetical protein